VILGALVPGAARAQTGAQIVLDPTTAAPGAVVEVAGTGFQSGTVTVHVDAVDPQDELATVRVTRGGFVVDFTVPDLAAGSHRVIACRDRLSSGACREMATATLTVSSPPTTTGPPLATTAPPTTGGFVAPTTAPPTTQPGVVVGPGPTGGAPTIPPDLAGSTAPVGPDPTFDPTPGDLAGQTTTTGLDEATNIPPGDWQDVGVRAIEVTQGIQDLQSRMPLVAQRRTYVRVHVESEAPGWGPVDGLLLLRRSGKPDLVLTPENGPITTGKDRTDLDAALNFLLPVSYLGAGDLEITAGVWSFDITSLADQEPDPTDNTRKLDVTLHTATQPNVWLVALDDGGGPGPVVDSLDVLLGFAVVVQDDLLDFHPLAAPTFDILPEPVHPGPEASEPGIWILDDTGTQRHEPNQRMQWYANEFSLFDTGFVLGMFDASIPSSGFSGWASYDVAWNKPVAGTPAHELGHNRGLLHVGCKDDDDNGVPDEAAGGAVDPVHPTGIPPVCSLAPIHPDGYFGLTVYRSPLTVFSNDPTHPSAAFPFMSYQSPKWTDPYHWCLLLDAYGVPCSPAAIGVPPKVLVSVDCDPEPVEAGGFQLDLCLLDQLPPPGDPELPPPPEPGGGNQDTEPEAPALVGLAAGGYAVVPAADARARRDLTTLLPLDPTAWVTVSGPIDLVARTGAIRQSVVHEELPAGARQRAERAVERRGPRGTPSVSVLRVVDAAGTMLALVPVDLDGAGHGGDSERGTSAGFFETVPWPAGAAAVELLVDGAVVDRRDTAGSPPTVEDVVVTVAGDGTARITWQASDPDGDRLLATVTWSADGERWIPLAVAVEDGDVTVGPDSAVPGGEAVRARVTVTDGMRTATATSEPVAVPERAPSVFVTGVTDGARVERHTLVELLAHAHDPEDGALGGEAVTWSSDRDGDLGSGRIVSTRDLSVGAHAIEARAVDAGGNVATAMITLTVVDGGPSRYGEPVDDRAMEWLASGDASVFAGDGGSSWPPLALGGIALVAVAGGVVVRRRARR
jgi:hypothetical protein